MTALSDYFYKGPTFTLHNGREINIQNIQQSLAYAHIYEGIPYGQQYEGIVSSHLRWAKERYPDRKIIVLEPRLRPLPIPEEELIRLKSLGDPPKKTEPQSLDEEETDTYALDCVIALSYKMRELVSIGSVCCLARFQSEAKGHAMQSELFVIWFQDGFALPIDPYVIEQIQAIDWDLYSEDFDL